MTVERWDVEREGPMTEAALRTKLEERGYRVARFVYPPGVCFPDHSHRIEKVDAVVSGWIRLSTADGAALLGPGDCVVIPRGLVHRAEVVGDEPVVSFDGSAHDPWPDLSEEAQ